MQLEIVSPERVLFSGEVSEVAVPGIHGEFQMLTNHAPVISVLKKGEIKLPANAKIPAHVEHLFSTTNHKRTFPIQGGIIELNDNKIIILVD